MINILEKFMSHKPKITIVIPTYSLTYELRDMAYKCALSHRKQTDQLIITEDGGKCSPQLQEIADIYLYSKQNVGFTKNVNRGWKLSDGDFTFIVNSDTELIEGNLIDMCEYQRICSPEIIKNLTTGFTGSYFSVPKEIQDKFGYLDERMRTFSSDIDYYARIKDFFRFESRVKILHHKSQTLKATQKDTQLEAKRDNDIYQEVIALEHPERIDWK